MFTAPEESERIEEVNNSLFLFKYEELNTTRGWVKVRDLTLEDVLIDEENNQVNIIEINDKGYKVEIIIGDNNV